MAAALSITFSRTPLIHPFLGRSRRSTYCVHFRVCQSHCVAEHLLSGVSWSVLPLCWSVRHVRVASASHLVLLVGCRRSLRGPSRLVGPSVTSAFASASHPCCWPVAVGRCVVRRAFRRPVRHARVCLRQSPCVAGRMPSGVAWSFSSRRSVRCVRVCFCQSPCVAGQLLSGVAWSVVPSVGPSVTSASASASHLVLLVGCCRALRGPSRRRSVRRSRVCAANHRSGVGQYCRGCVVRRVPVPSRVCACLSPLGCRSVAVGQGLLVHSVRRALVPSVASASALASHHRVAGVSLTVTIQE